MVSWSLDTGTGELHFKPTNGHDGTFDSNTDNRWGASPCYQYGSSVRSVTSEGIIHGSQSMSYMFQSLPGLTEVSGLDNWDTSSVRDMSFMFYGCSSLSRLYVSNWDTSGVTDYYSHWEMFSGIDSISIVTFGSGKSDPIVNAILFPSYSTPYTSKWVSVDGRGPYTGSELAGLSTDERAGTWVREGTNVSPYTISFDANGGVGSLTRITASPLDKTVTLPDGSALVRSESTTGVIVPSVD